MTAIEVLRYLQQEIHTTVAATADREGRPVTCAIDIMAADENGLYFLTAKGKGFYTRLKEAEYMALTGMKGDDTLSCVAVSVRGKVKELGGEPLPRLLDKNPYTRAAESGLISLRSRSNGFPFPSVRARQNPRDIVLRRPASAVGPVRRYVRSSVLILRRFRP